MKRKSIRKSESFFVLPSAYGDGYIRRKYQNRDGSKKVMAVERGEVMRERREVKGEVLQSEILYRMIVEAVHDIIWVLDIQGNFTFLNRCCEEACG